MSIKTKLIIASVLAAFTMGTAFAADEAPAADASAPVKTVKKAHKKVAKKAAKKAEAPAADASAPAAK